MMSLWAIFRSPLMFGGELRDNDEWTNALLTNDEVLQLHRNGRNAKQLYREGERIVWVSQGQSGTLYVALFNAGDEEDTVSVSLDELGLSDAPHVRNLWEREDLGHLELLSFSLPPHSSLLLKLS